METKTLELTKDTRIYYGGDMANNSGFGTITEAVRDKWGSFITIKMDDGRDINRLPLCAFSAEYLGHGGTRFVTIEAYNAYRQGLCEHMGIEWVDIN